MIIVKILDKIEKAEILLGEELIKEKLKFVFNEKKIKQSGRLIENICRGMG